MSAALLGAAFSPDHKYRYTLWRTWLQSKPALVFVMLNPSTADERRDDPTIRKCCGFARRLGYGGILVANLFAIRSTEPRGILDGADPIGPENDDYLDTIFRPDERHPVVVAAWGAPPGGRALRELVMARARAVSLLSEASGRKLHHLGLSKDGHPRHPLMLGYDAEMSETWRPADGTSR